MLRRSFFLLRALVKSRELFKEPKGNKPPPWWIRGVLILTCTGVSFAHGSNDGQKGMGLIMLILVGTVPIVFAQPRHAGTQFHRVRRGRQSDPGIPERCRRKFQTDHRSSPGPFDLRSYQGTERRSRAGTGRNRRAVFASKSRNTRRWPRCRLRQSRMFATRCTWRQKPSVRSTRIRNSTRTTTRGPISRRFKATRRRDQVYPALGEDRGRGRPRPWHDDRLEADRGYRRPEDRQEPPPTGRVHRLSWWQCTIGAADMFGLPVSTTHVLSSGVAGTMAANRSGLQMNTIRNLLMAWVLTLPAAITLSGSLYWLFAQVL